jgi:hypothetical protein
MRRTTNELRRKSAWSCRACFQRLESCLACLKVRINRSVAVRIGFREWRSLFCSVAVLAGFLAKSLCDFRSWKTSDPLQESILERDGRSPSLCYSSSFPLSLKTEGTALFSEDKGAPVDPRSSGLERAVLEAKRNFRFIQREHRFAAVSFDRDPASSRTVKVEYLESWLAGSPSTADSWKAVLPSGGATGSTDVLAVLSTTRQGALDKLEYSWIQRAGSTAAPGPSSIVEIPVPKYSTPTSVQTAIAGEGFHRRYVMDVKVLESASQDRTILVRVPVSSTAYIDLDEIRVGTSKLQTHALDRASNVCFFVCA